MIRKVALIVVALSLLHGELYAQKEFLPGYVITNKLDTLHGFINNGTYQENALMCLFRQELESETLTYLPEDILGYRFVDGKYYVHHHVELNGTKQDVFLEYLIDGQLDIYFITDEQRNGHYFASKEEGKLVELQFGEISKVVDGITLVRDNTQYIGVLNALTQDVPAMQEYTYRLAEPEHKNLIRYASKYHKMSCGNDDCLVYEKPKRSSKYILFHGGSSIFFDNITDLGTIYAPSFGLSTLFQQPRLSERIYIGAGVVIDYLNYADEGLSASDGESVEKYWVRTPLSVYYIHNKQGLSPLVGYDFTLSAQALRSGLKYTKGTVSATLIADIYFSGFVVPVGCSPRLGIMLRL